MATRRTGGRLIPALALALAAALVPAAAADEAATGLRTGDFAEVVEPGFGDPANNFAWAMHWFKGRLYVGTARKFGCVQRAIQATYIAGVSYPPDDPLQDCPDSPQDLEVAAEIWAWDPATDEWSVKFRSPEDVEIPGHPGKFVARDIGFRDVAVMTEPDGTEAIYFGGASSRDYNIGVPLPRILRSTDGETFEPLPQEPGTYLGDLDVEEGVIITTFGRMAVYDGRLFVIAGGAYGHGVLLEAREPALGNDAFRRVSPAGVTVTALTPYNGFLYVASGANPLPSKPPYEIWKTDATGSPYGWRQVVQSGGGRLFRASRTVVHMREYGGLLWAGTNQPAELLRIHPDDSWELIMGQPRSVDGRRREPISGLGDGFDWSFNIHIHRMAGHDGWLYLSTDDQSNTDPFNQNPDYAAKNEARFGFDLYRTRDGVAFYPVTLTAFDSPEAFTGRTLESTPAGLFLGSGSYRTGLQVWRAQTPPGGVQSEPTRLEVETGSGQALFSWEPAPGAVVYHLYGGSWLTDFEFEHVTSTAARWIAIDKPGVVPEQFYVIAEDAAGNRSMPSNLVTAPAKYPPESYRSARGYLVENGAPSDMLLVFDWSRVLFLRYRYLEATARLEELRATIAAVDDAPFWIRDDALRRIDRLIRRVRLVELGVLPRWKALFG